MPKILELDSNKARAYLLEEKNYVNFDLPQYFSFQKLLDETARIMDGAPIRDFLAQRFDETGRVTGLYNPADMEAVNYRLLSNKDGEFAWRPFEIIHPALYVALVNELTSDKSWDELTRRFRYFGTSNVTCVSIPFCSDDEESHKAHQVKEWWTNIEQASLKLSLSFQYVYDVDVADCYGSIYTHAIAWALHTKERAKANKNSMDLLGNRLDTLIRKMRYNQTNGIPQGSTIMDLIAEIVLGAIDKELSTKLDLSLIPASEYSIVRYRDDYKILTNNPEYGRRIVKELSAVLSDWGMKLNVSKTKMSTDPVIASVKPDKLAELFVPEKKHISVSKKLLQIYEASNKFPNSGQVVRLLSDYYELISNKKELDTYDDPLVMIGIITNLALRNPRCYPWATAIMSHVLDFCHESDRLQIIQQIHTKFEQIPNTGLLDIWLQRISYKVDPKMPFSESLAKIASGELTENVIWESVWLNSPLRDVISSTPILNREVQAEMPTTIPKEEVELFRSPLFS